MNLLIFRSPLCSLISPKYHSLPCVKNKKKSLKPTTSYSMEKKRKKQQISLYALGVTMIAKTESKLQ